MTSSWPPQAAVNRMLGLGPLHYLSYTIWADQGSSTHSRAGRKAAQPLLPAPQRCHQASALRHARPPIGIFIMAPAAPLCPCWRWVVTAACAVRCTILFEHQQQLPLPAKHILEALTRGPALRQQLVPHRTCQRCRNPSDPQPRPQVCDALASDELRGAAACHSARATAAGHGRHQ